MITKRTSRDYAEALGIHPCLSARDSVSRYFGATPTPALLRGPSTRHRLTVDHVIPTALGGPDTPDNLTTACEGCNSGKSSVPADAPLVVAIRQDAERWARAMCQAPEEAEKDHRARQEYRTVFAEAWAAHPVTRNAKLPTWGKSVDALGAAGLDRHDGMGGSGVLPHDCADADVSCEDLVGWTELGFMNGPLHGGQHGLADAGSKGQGPGFSDAFDQGPGAVGGYGQFLACLGEAFGVSVVPLFCGVLSSAVETSGAEDVEESKGEVDVGGCFVDELSRLVGELPGLGVENLPIEPTAVLEGPLRSLSVSLG